MSRTTVRSAPGGSPRGFVADLVRVPFRAVTWRHMLHALLAPLGLAWFFAVVNALRISQEEGVPQLGIAGALVATALAVACVGAFGRARARWFFGIRMAPGQGRGRLGRTLGYFFVDLLLSGLAFALAAGVVIVCARNLTYPIWGWAPYPNPAWGGPTPEGAVALHFAGGVVALFVGPRLVTALSRAQLRLTQRMVGAG
ncbi:hypothetical protein AB0B50_12525 [Streptomyces sp. NPDC041068]|uniref:hypothetical protein n=1 Tax=Streptomyces sp. NPDC041068 TaxID=3155130 RepID=UPI0033D35800